MSVTLNGTSGLVFSDGTIQGTAAGMPFRNMVINGDMRIAQRATSVSGITAQGYYTVDRFRVFMNTIGTYTMSQETDAPTGFNYSLKMLCTTADASPAAADYNIIGYDIESQNMGGLQYGTASAMPVAISFWAKSNVTGLYIVDIFNFGSSTRQISASYTINAANTWEYKTIIIPGDTAVAIKSDNTTGFRIHFWLGTGSDHATTTLNTSWRTHTGNTGRATGQVNVSSAVNNYFSMTGLQVERAAAPTSFEYRPYGTELALCQRYFQTHGTALQMCKSHGYDLANYRDTKQMLLPVIMRASPTVSKSGLQTYDDNGSAAPYGASVNVSADTYKVISYTTFTSQPPAGYWTNYSYSATLSAEL